MNYVFTIVSRSFPKSGFSSFLLGKDCRMVIRTALFSPARETSKASVFFWGSRATSRKRIMQACTENQLVIVL